MVEGKDVIEKKRITIVTHTYWPSHDAVSQLLRDLTKYLSRNGAEITIVTSGLNYMSGQRLPIWQQMEGVRIWRIPVVKQNKKKTLNKALGYVTFWALHGPALAMIGKTDVLIYLSAPPFLGWSATIKKLFCDVKTIYIAQDIYPEIPEVAGFIRNREALKILKKIDRAILNRMDKVVVLGKKMREIVERKGVPRKKIEIIPNWSILPKAEKGSRKGNQLLKELGIEKKFVVQYSGNMGVVHEITPILDAATILKERKDISFLFIGDGMRRDEVIERKRKDKLDNVTIIPYRPIEELANSLAGADAALISMKSEMEGLVFPSKIYGIMESGRPVINVGAENGEIAEIVNKAKCGYNVQDGQQIVEAIECLVEDKKKREEMGSNSLKYFKDSMGKNRSLKKYLELIENIDSSE